MKKLKSVACSPVFPHIIVGRLRVRFGGGAKRGPGGHDAAGGEEQPADAAALRPQGEGEATRSNIALPVNYQSVVADAFFNIFSRQAMKLDSVEVELSQMVQEQKSWDTETRTLRSQLDKAEEMVRQLLSRTPQF